MAQKEKIDYQLRIKSIKEALININLDFLPEDQSKPVDCSFELKTGINIKVEEDVVTISFPIILEIFFKPGEENKQIGNLATIVNFELKNDKRIPQTENSINLPNDLVVKLLDLAVSTVRGIVYVRLKGILGKDAILPVFDVGSLAKQIMKDMK